MLIDIATVARKELREILFPDGRASGSLRNGIVFVGLVGLLFPLQTGPTWFTRWMTVQAACFPIILTLNYAADSFAGERERHTLETLMATRLDATAVLFGKIVAIVLYVWAIVVACQVVAVVGLNVVYRDGGFIFYRPPILLAILVMSFLTALVLCAAGALVSLTAPTVRAAGQRLLVPFLAMCGLPALMPLIVEKLGWEYATVRLSPGEIVLMLAAACAVTSGILLAAGIKRFTRERVVLA